MDFAPLHKGIAGFLAGVVASVNSSFMPVAPAPSVPSLQVPEINESYNLTSEIKHPEASEDIQNLSEITDEDNIGLELVIKEVEAAEPVITVEEPPRVYTVAIPTPKPSPSIAPQEPEKDDPGEPQASIEPKVEEKIVKPSPSSSPSPSTSPANVQLASSNAELLFKMTNEHRVKIGKQALEKDERLCKIAESRAPQVKGELSSGTLHKGFRELNLPYWATENLAAYQTMEENFNFLVTDYIHRKAIEGDAKYSCVACAGTSCSQIFSSFIPK